MLFVFFLCTSLGGAEEVAYATESLVEGVSPLPSDCRWTREQIQTLKPETIVLVGDRYYTVAKVSTPTGLVGYSAGYPFTS